MERLRAKLLNINKKDKRYFIITGIKRVLTFKIKTQNDNFFIFLYCVTLTSNFLGYV